LSQDIFLKMMRLIETIYRKRKEKEMDQIFQVKKVTTTRKAEEIEAQVVLTFAINDQKGRENLFELVRLQQRYVKADFQPTELEVEIG